MRFALFVWLLLSSSIAAAQTPRAFFDEGTALYNIGQFAKAAEKFEASYAARPLPITKFNVARAWEQAGETLKAIDAWQAWRLMSPGPGPDADEAARAIEKLGQKLAKLGVQALTISTLPPGALVTLDGTLKGRAPITLELTASKHLLKLELDGRRPEERMVEISLAKPEVQTFELGAAEPSLAPPPLTRADATPLAVPLPPPMVPRATDPDFAFQQAADTVYVHLDSDNPAARLYRGSGNPAGECRAPCDAPINRATDTFAIAGEGITPSSSFVLADHQQRGRATIKVKTGSWGLLYFFSVGLGTLGIAGTVTGIVFLGSSTTDKTLPAIALVGGLLAGVGAVLGSVLNLTTVEFQ